MSAPAIRVTVAQINCLWHRPDANRQYLAELFSEVAGKTDLIVLPEMFTSGFTQFPEKVDSQYSIEWMQQQAERCNAAIVGSLAVELPAADEMDSSDFVNRLVFVEPSGVYHYYDKVHLFTMADEHKRYRAGNERKLIHYQGWRILPIICYDLRFPVFCRNQNDYDLMLCVANWPFARRLHWRSLLQARAIENQAYVVGVNRVGTDGNGLQYNGDSMVISMQGEHLFDGQAGKEALVTVALEQEALKQYRDKFPVWQDADGFTLSL